MLKLLYAFFVSLPELLRLVKVLQRNLAEAETRSKVKDDVAKIRKAFEAKDEEALNSIFNS